MQPKFLQLSGQKVAYYESEGTAVPIMLIHGNSASGLTYQHQLNSTLGQTHRIIAIDLPGHGQSDPADISAYNMPGYAQVIAAAAEALGIQDGIFVGWSLGGHIVLEAHNRLPQAKGFMIYGTPPLAFPPAMENAFLPNPAMGAAFSPDMNEAAATAFAGACLAPGCDIPYEPFVTDILRTDGTARAGLAASIAPSGYQDEVEIVANLERPLAILHGEQEQLVNGDYIKALTIPALWRGEMQVIAGSGHTPHWEAPEQFNALLAAFVADVA
ncbi:MAG: alpha/beta hydrolase [Ardenticatenaceae bacterium]|nr:alpha/beta hydrolase [Ardenticatenaceae bacterium]